jgi:hypothetical protein
MGKARNGISRRLRRPCADQKKQAKAFLSFLWSMATNIRRISKISEKRQKSVFTRFLSTASVFSAMKENVDSSN